MHVVVRLVAGLAGAALVLAVLASAVKTVVLPRAAVSAISRATFLVMRKLFSLFAPERSSYARRDRVFALYAPVTLLLLPGVWVALVIAGFTLLFVASGVSDLRSAFVLSGSSMLTLGVRNRGALPSEVLTFAQATLGLGLVALQISYLPSIYAAFSRREMLVGKLEVRAGRPPSAAELLTRYQRIGWLGSVDTELIPDWEDWFMDVEETHTSLPAMVFLRSPQPERHWLSAAGCVLDTAALVASTLDRPRSPRSELLVRAGSLSLRRIADVFGLPYDPDPRPTDPIRVSRREWDLLCVELEAAGVPLKADRDAAWASFAGWRVNYDAALVQLAALCSVPESRWLSDRVPARPKVRFRRRLRVGRSH